MGDSGVPGDDSIMEQFDWEHLLDNTPQDFNFFDVEIDPSLLSDFSNPSPDLVSLSVHEIEQLLMKDEFDDGDKANLEVPNHEFSNGFLSDILLDSPVECDGSGSGEVVHVSDGNNSNSSEEEEKNSDVEVELKEDNNGDFVGDADDPISKKRKRQLRNRDAAVRSRERKKMYVRDLEMKSRYFEGECKRLGMLLQCYLAENQSLRLSLQNSKAFDASMTKQESAVLLLESLLLGSLLWFLGIVCLFILPRLTRSTLEAVQLENVENKNQGGLAPRNARSKIFRDLVFQSSMIGKRCKASRSRMKPSSLTLEVLV